MSPLNQLELLKAYAYAAMIRNTSGGKNLKTETAMILGLVAYDDWELFGRRRADKAEADDHSGPTADRHV